MTSSGDKGLGHGPMSIDAAIYADVQNLYAFYNFASDEGNAEAYANCFSPNGVLEIPSIGLRVTGYSALLAFKEADRDRRGDRLRRHWNSGLYLERVNEDTARGRCYLHGYNNAPGKAPVLGIPRDQLQEESRRLASGRLEKAGGSGFLQWTFAILDR